MNVGRTVINGERLGGVGSRGQYLMGSDFAASLRDTSIERYRDLFRTYGRRSSPMPRWCSATRSTSGGSSPRIHSSNYAMWMSESWRALDITARTGLKLDEVKRFNPVLGARARRRPTCICRSM